MGGSPTAVPGIRCSSRQWCVDERAEGLPATLADTGKKGIEGIDVALDLIRFRDVGPRGRRVVMSAKPSRALRHRRRDGPAVGLGDVREQPHLPGLHTDPEPLDDAAEEHLFEGTFPRGESRISRPQPVRTRRDVRSYDCFLAGSWKSLRGPGLTLSATQGSSSAHTPSSNCCAPLCSRAGRATDRLRRRGAEEGREENGNHRASSMAWPPSSPRRDSSRRPATASRRDTARATSRPMRASPRPRRAVAPNW